MIARIPTLCAAGATVIWTRGGWEPDLRPAIRGWFRTTGFEEVGFDADGAGWAVGATLLVAEPQPYVRGLRLFDFQDDLRGR